MSFVIDQGSKEIDQYEYYPLASPGPCVVSIDIGKLRYAIFIMGSEKCYYAGLWRLGEKMNITLQRRLTTLLNRLKPLFQQATTILVEQQQASNYMAVRLQQHTLTYFELLYPHIEVVSVAATIKYSRLNGPLGDQKHKRKSWAIEKACEMLAPDVGVVRYIKALEELKSQGLKGDDVSDAYLQYEAWRLR